MTARSARFTSTSRPTRTINSALRAVLLMNRSRMLLRTVLLPTGAVLVIIRARCILPPHPSRMEGWECSRQRMCSVAALSYLRMVRAYQSLILTLIPNDPEWLGWNFFKSIGGTLALVNWIQPFTRQAIGRWSFRSLWALCQIFTLI